MTRFSNLTSVSGSLSNSDMIIVDQSIGGGWTTLKATLAQLATWISNLTINGNAIGYRGIPRRTSGWANGECLSTTTGQTINTSDMVAGYAFSFFNSSGSSWTLTAGAGVTLYFNGASVATVTVGARGVGTVWCDTGAVCVVTGSNLS